jgi:hypothetical protein
MLLMRSNQMPHFHDLVSELDDRTSAILDQHCDLEAATSAQKLLGYEKQSLRESNEQLRRNGRI